MKRFSPEAIISTFFGIGKFPFMPGTVASFVSTILVALLFYQPHFVEKQGEKYLEMGAIIISPNLIIYVLSLAAIFTYIIGVWASERYSKGVGLKDPGSVVIDEVAGIFTACSLTACVYAFLLYFWQEQFILYLIISYYYFPAIFILFRIFDIAKPWHVGMLDKKYDGGFGIMIDDIMAAVYTCVAFYAIFFLLKYLGILDKMVAV